MIGRRITGQSTEKERLNICIVGYGMATGGILLYGTDPTKLSMLSMSPSGFYNIAQLLDGRLVAVGISGTIAIIESDTKVFSIDNSQSGTFYAATGLSDGNFAITGSNSGKILYGNDLNNISEIAISPIYEKRVIKQLSNNFIVTVGSGILLSYGNDIYNLTTIDIGKITNVNRFNDITQLSDGTIIIVGTSGYVLYGYDITNILSFTLLRITSYDLLSITQLLDSTIVITCINGYIAYGQSITNMTVFRINTSITSSWNDITQLSDGMIITVNDSSNIAYGTNILNLTTIRYTGIQSMAAVIAAW